MGVNALWWVPAPVEDMTAAFVKLSACGVDVEGLRIYAHLPRQYRYGASTAPEGSVAWTFHRYYSPESTRQIGSWPHVSAITSALRAKFGIVDYFPDTANQFGVAFSVGEQARYWESWVEQIR